MPPPAPRPPPRPRLTHFVCIPLAGGQLVRNLASFRADVAGDLSVPEGAVRPAGSMHLTLGVMSLDASSTTRAVEVLRGLKLREMLTRARVSGGVTGGGELGTTSTQASTRMSTETSLSLTLRGLHPMQSSSSTSVLYAAPSDEEGMLRPFCEQIRAAFLEEGLVTDDERPLLLHATIVNTVYAAKNKKRRGKIMLDARDLERRYDEHVWLEDMPVDRVAICRMGMLKDEERYAVEAEVEF